MEVGPGMYLLNYKVHVERVLYVIIGLPTYVQQGITDCRYLMVRT